MRGSMGRQGTGWQGGGRPWLWAAAVEEGSWAWVRANEREREGKKRGRRHGRDGE